MSILAYMITSISHIQLASIPAFVFAIATLIPLIVCTSARSRLGSKNSFIGALVVVFSFACTSGSASTSSLRSLVTLCTTPAPFCYGICVLVLAILGYILLVITTQAIKIRSLEASLRTHKKKERCLQSYAIGSDLAAWRLLGKLDRVRAENSKLSEEVAALRTDLGAAKAELVNERSKHSEQVAALQTGLAAAEAKLVDKDLALEKKEADNLVQAATTGSLEATVKRVKNALAAARSSVADKDTALKKTRADLREAKELIRAACDGIETLQAQAESADLQIAERDAAHKKALARVAAKLHEQRTINKELGVDLVAKNDVIRMVESERDEACLTVAEQGKTIEELLSKVQVNEEDRASQKKELDAAHAKIARVNGEVDSLLQQCDYLSNEAIIRSWELTAHESRWLTHENAMRKTIHDLCSIIEEAGLVSQCDEDSPVDRSVDFDEQVIGKESRKNCGTKSRTRTRKAAQDAENIVPAGTTSPSWSSSASTSTLAASPGSVANSSATLDPASPTSSKLADETTNCAFSNSSMILAHQSEKLPQAVLTPSASANVGVLDVSLPLEALPLSVSSEMLFNIELDYPSWAALSPSPSVTSEA